MVNIEVYLPLKFKILKDSKKTPIGKMKRTINLESLVFPINLEKIKQVIILIMHKLLIYKKDITKMVLEIKQCHIFKYFHP